MLVMNFLKCLKYQPVWSFCSMLSKSTFITWAIQAVDSSVLEKSYASHKKDKFLPANSIPVTCPSMWTPVWRRVFSPYLKWRPKSSITHYFNVIIFMIDASISFHLLYYLSFNCFCEYPVILCCAFKQLFNSILFLRLLQTVAHQPLMMRSDAPSMYWLCSFDVQRQDLGGLIYSCTHFTIVVNYSHLFYSHIVPRSESQPPKCLL